MYKMPVLLPVLGGIKVLLMLFARVVEMNASEDIQVWNLDKHFVYKHGTPARELILINK